MMTIALLGLGAMGSRMAANLLKAGFDVAVWNRGSDKARPLADLGATVAGSPRAAAMDRDVVISMVTDDGAARSIWLDGASGALGGLKAGAIAIESSTVTAGWIRELSVAVAKRGAELLDAPVAGSRPQAEAGQLVFMVGGAAATLEHARPVLDAMSAKVLHIGDAGQGAVLKLAINALFAAQLASVAELLGSLGRQGFEANRTAELLANFPIVAPPIAAAARMMAAKDATPLFTIDLIEKDLGYALAAAGAAGASMPTIDAVRASFRAAQAAGHGSSNVSSLARLFA